MQFSNKILELTAKAEEALSLRFAQIDRVSFANTQKIMEAFRRNRVDEAMFNPTSGYGYGDRGREALDRIWAEVMGAESAFVRHSIVNGTQALTIGLFGLLRPGDILFSIAGKPYDTLDEEIGNVGTPGNGSLRDFDVEYREADLLPDGSFDREKIAQVFAADGDRIKVVFIQRSKGYLNRKTLSVAEIGDIIATIRTLSDHCYVVVDNCYGEFTEEREPTAVGADMIIGSLIKNPGGGMAESGGYIAGSARAVELASYRLTSVGCGCEVGATLGQNKSLFKGLFYAPHTTAQAIKTAHLAAYLFGKEGLGFDVEPEWNEVRYDIIQAVITHAPESLCAICRGIQAGSPIDAHVIPEPWDMPGYTDKVIMAAGAFTQGSSIELSADGPIRPPYTAYLQGGLTYESGKIGIMSAAEEVIRCGALPEDSKFF